MLDKIKILLGLGEDDTTKDELLTILIAMCKDEAVSYCNLEKYIPGLDTAVIEMVISRYNRIGSEGLSSITTSGIKEDYNSEFGSHILRKLRKYRRVKFI